MVTVLFLGVTGYIGGVFFSPLTVKARQSESDSLASIVLLSLHLFRFDILKQLSDPVPHRLSSSCTRKGLPGRYYEGANPAI